MMKRMLCLFCAVVVCLLMACPVFAAEDTFVPSIGYKDGPEIDDSEMNGEDVGDCLEITSITEAEEKSTDISQDARDELLEVYEGLVEGDMELPIDDKEYVVRDLVDVSFKETTCIGEEHGHKEDLAEDGTTITITFDMGVDEETEVIVLVYIDGEWVPAEEVINNGDGTVTVTFEDICPVAFCVERGSVEPPKTGDDMGQNMILWIVLMAVSLAAIVTLVVLRGRKAR